MNQHKKLNEVDKNNNWNNQFIQTNSFNSCEKSDSETSLLISIDQVYNLVKDEINSRSI